MENITNWNLTEAKENLLIRESEMQAQQDRVDSCICTGNQTCSKNKACNGQSIKAVPFVKAKGRLRDAESLVECISQHGSIVERIKAEVQLGSVFFLNHSGGKDSQTQQILVERYVPADQICVVHADLGSVEWGGIKEHIAATTDHKLNVVHAISAKGERRTLLGYVYERFAKLTAEGKSQPTFPSASNRWCTSMFKTGPIAKFMKVEMKRRGTKRAVNCMGIRAEESAERSNNVPMRVNRDMSKAGRTVIDWLPIFDMKMEGYNGVWDIIASANQIRHFAYDLGMSRLSCCFCIMGRNSDIRIAAKERPELFAEYVKAEQDTGFTLMSGASLVEIVEGKNAKEQEVPQSA